MARNLRVIGLLVLLLAGAVSLVAAPPYEIDYEYYNDPALTDWCGYRYITCTGIYSYGCRTSYYTYEEGPAC